MRQLTYGGQAIVYIVNASTFVYDTIAKIFTNATAYDEISGELESLMRVR